MRKNSNVTLDKKRRNRNEKNWVNARHHTANNKCLATNIEVILASCCLIHTLQQAGVIV